MPRNGSGVYNLPPGNPVVPGTIIQSIWANTTMADIAAALTNSISKDGQTVPTANLPMGGFKFTNVGLATVPTDYARADQVQGQRFNVLTAVGGVGNAYTGTLALGTVVFVQGMFVIFTVPGTNTGPSTLQINGSSVNPIVDANGFALTAGALPAGGIMLLAWDGASWRSVLAPSTAGLRVFSVRDYGAVGNGSTDDTASINAAIAALIANGSGVLYFSSGTYNVTTLNTLSVPTWVLGQGRGSSIIRTTVATGNVFNVTGPNSKFSDLQVTASVARTAGAHVLVAAAAIYFHASDCTFTNALNGILTAADRVVISDCNFLETVATGLALLVSNGIGGVVIGCTFSNAGTQPVAGIGVQTVNALSIIGCSTNRQGTGLFLNPVGGQTITGVYVTNCDFDNGLRGIDLVPGATSSVVNTRILQCRMLGNTTNGLRATGGTGTVVDGLIVSECTVVGNGADGVFIATTAVPVLNVRVLAGLFAQNTGAGILFSGCTDFSVNGAKCGAAAGVTGNTTFGINISSTTCDFFNISNNDLRGNTSGGLNNATTITTATWITFDNLGETNGVIVSSGRVQNMKTATFLPVVNDGSASGSPKNIDFTAGQYHTVTMNGTPITFTFTPPVGPCVVHLQVVQDATGNRLWVLPAGKWDQSYAAVDKALSTTANAIDLLVARWDGSGWFYDLKKNFT